MENDFDVVVVGAGPAGSSAAFFCSKNGLKVLLLDKAKFPRDKTCGDAVSGKSVGILKKMGLNKKMSSLPHGNTNGVIFSSPAGDQVQIGYPSSDNRGGEGYVCRREIYDNFLFENAKKISAKTIQEFMVTDVLKEGEQVIGVKGKGTDGTEKEFYAKVVVGADGATSIVANKMGLSKINPKHQCIAARAYYSNIKNLTPNIEIHFIKSIMPGYFWIFPCENGNANVGVGILASDLKKDSRKLTERMLDAIKNDELFKERFKDAKMISEIKGWQLPLGSSKRKLAGNGFVLCGDAGSLIDPFTGEGMGNGMTSGYYAAQVISDAFKRNNFTEKKLSEYEKKLWKEIEDEINSSHLLQRLGKHQWLLNFVINKAATKKEVRDMMSGMLANENAAKKFYSPWFYLKLLFS
ncbi:MAG: geranylgeranyl reductase family protein [Candidatus Diapherotrites archaeon]